MNKADRDVADSGVGDLRGLLAVGDRRTDAGWRVPILKTVASTGEGIAEVVDETYELDDTFTLIPTPGHSPCHCCVRMRSQGQEAVVTGDLMHHALQCRQPDWSTIFDTDPAQAAHSRRRVLGPSADTAHF